MPGSRNDAKPRAPVLGLVLVGLSAVLVLTTIYLAYAVAPVERQMGIVQKIFYFHVPSAYAMYLAFGACFVGCVGYLAKRTPGWDALSVAGAEVGLVFCANVLITGPLWARKAWGTYWTWDPRLTTTLLVAMIYAAYVVLRAFGTGGEAEKKFAAVLGILGVLDIPLIHYSVRKWSGQHPQVISQGGGGLHPDMVPALVSGFAAFTALAVLLLWARVRVERGRQRREALELAAAERGWLEDT